MTERWVNPEHADLVDRAQQAAAAPGLFRAFQTPAGDQTDLDEAQPE
jgi:hypothetical protein